MVLSAFALLATLQTPDSLTLEEALARAREARPRVAGAGAAVDRARGAARLGRMIPNPTAQFESHDASPRFKIAAAQSLGWVLRRGADAAAGRAGVARALADSVQEVAAVGRDVRHAFFGAIAASRQLELASEQASLADSLAAYAARRAAAGEISNLEREQIGLEAARASVAAAQAREADQLARIALALAVTWTDSRLPTAAGSLDQLLGTERSADSTAVSDTLPSVRAAIADADAASARLRAARLARIPIPGVIASRDWNGGRDVMLGVTLPVPLWSRGNEAVAYARGDAAARAAAAAEARLAGDALLTSARYRLRATATRAMFARDSLLPQARRVRAGAVRLYEAGSTSVVPVLDALRAERDVARLAVAEMLAFQDARADLDAVLGRWR